MRRAPPILLAGLSGFVALAMQLVWFRAFDLASGGRPVSFGLLLGAYLFGVAVGAAVVRNHVQTDAVTIARRLGALLFAASVASFAVLPTLGWLSLVTSSPHLWGCAVVAVAAGLLGAVLPLAAQWASLSGQRPAWAIALTYGANVAGSTLGPLVATFVLLEQVGMARAAQVLVLVTTLLSIACFVAARHAVGAACVALAMVAMTTLHRPLHDDLSERLVLRRPGWAGRFAQVVENRASLIAVSQDGRVYGGGVYDGAINTSPLRPANINMIDRAYVALLLQHRPRRVLEIGLSAGAWAQVLANAPGVESLTSVELNPAYLELVARHDAVKSLLTNPKVRIVVADGRTWLAASDEQFDLIVINTTFHWRSHVTTLLSSEFFDLIRRRLTPGGVVYLNTTDSPDVLRTVAVAFPFTHTYKNFVAGSMQPFRLDRAAFEATLRGYVIDGKRVFGDGHERELKALAHVPLAGDRKALLSRVRGARVITDDNLATEFDLLR